MLCRLRKGFKLDVFDTASVPPQWMEAEVTAAHRSSIEVHYTGWSDKYDTTVDSSEYKQRIAALGSYSEVVVHYSCCMLCDEGGDNRTLVCCDGCPRVVHLQCVRLRSLPKGDYFCPDCVKSKRGKRSTQEKRDVAQYEETDGLVHDDDDEETVDDEREKENRTNRAASTAPPVAPATVRRGANVSKLARNAAPAFTAASASASAPTVKRPDRRALATKAGRPRLGSEAGLKPIAQQHEQKEANSMEDEDDEVLVDEDFGRREEKQQPLPSRKRVRSDISIAEQTADRGSRRTAAVSSPSSPQSLPEVALPPVPQPVPSPPIHLAAGVSSAANQSSRKRVRANSTTQQPQQQPPVSGRALSSTTESAEEKKESTVENNRNSAPPLGSFVDCYKFQATRRGKGAAISTLSSSSSSTASSFTADGLPAVGIPPFSFPPSNFDDCSVDAYIAHFCSLLDMAGDKVNLSVPSELPGVERWERIREKMEEVGTWMRMKCNQQINGEQDAVEDNNQLIKRQTGQWKEQLGQYQQRLKEATEQRQAVVDEIAAIDEQIEQLRLRRELRAHDIATKQADLSQLDADKDGSKREHDRKVAELEANVRRATHRVRMLRDLSEHVATRRAEGDEKEQASQYWEPLDTIRRRCASMTSGGRLREADRTNSNGSERKEEVKELDETRPVNDEEEESKTAPPDVTAALDGCVDVGLTAFVDQPLQHSQQSEVYRPSTVVDSFIYETAAMHSADAHTPLHLRSFLLPSHLRLASASFGSLSSLSSASTVSDVPQVMLSSSDDSVNSTQTTLPVSPAYVDGAAEGWEAEQHQQQRMDMLVEETGGSEDNKELDSVLNVVDADEALPPSNALSDLSGVRRLSGESLDELTAVAEEQLTPTPTKRAVSAEGSVGTSTSSGGG